MKRREFIRNSLAATALAATAFETKAAPASGAGGKQEYYELRAYRLKKDSSHELLDKYLEQAAIPAWNKVGIKPVGVFTEIEPKGAPTVFVLIPYESLEVMTQAVSTLENDETFKKAASEYLSSPKDKPAFERIDSWLMLAFAGIPKMELPAYSKEKKPRIFEIRTYESYSEQKALKKIDMFNSGEIDVMREVGLAPVFFGQALIGPNLPHLTYMLSGENQDEHKKHWGVFGKHPVWDKMKNDPQYADTVSKITNWMVAPTAYSQI